MNENPKIFIILPGGIIKLYFVSEILSMCLHKNTQVTEAWNKIAQSFKCSPIEGECLSHICAS